MFVIADIEWVTNLKRQEAPVQLAALRVNDLWERVDTFASFIQPQNETFHQWEHMAYSGGRKEDFLNARGIFNVFERFESWLSEEDIVLWWHPDSRKLFEKTVRNVLKREDEHKAFCLCDYVYVVYKNKSFLQKNPYKMAEKCGVETILPAHCATNDVEVLRRLMEKLQFPQSLLTDGHIKAAMETEKFDESILYVYEMASNRIHTKGCEKISDEECLRGYRILDKAVKRGYKPCECCRKDYREVIRRKNENILKCSGFAYIYLSSSEVYHRKDCKRLSYSKNLMGTYSYESVVKMGKRPCRLCKPLPNDVKFTTPEKLKKKSFENFINNNLRKSEKNAVVRHKQAVRERERMLKKENLTEQERNDIYTLTQPRFTFWAARGYQTFHLSGCRKLRQVSDIKGFSTFKEATSYKLTPCRVCKPTAKYDAKLSIPINSKMRKDESFYCLEDKAKRAGFEYKEAEDFVSIFTPVGKWKIFYKKFPIKIEHKNLIYGEESGYHEQPRLFLSFSDTFDYIKKHDEKLMERSGRNINILIGKMHCG